MTNIKLAPEKLVKIQKKLGKLLALSASPNEAEAALALAKCQELMDKYQISSVDIDPVSLKVSTKDKFIKSTGKRMPKWVGILAASISAQFDVLVISNRDTTGWSGMTFIGGSSDVEIVTDLFIRLKRTIGRMGKIFMDSTVLVQHTSKSRDAYCMGVTITIERRLREQLKVRSTSKELVVIKKDEVKKHMNELFGANIKSANVNIDYTDQSALRKGLIDGENVPLNKSIKTENGFDRLHSK